LAVAGRADAARRLRHRECRDPLGEFESGLTAAWFGTVPSMVIGGVGTLVVVLLWIRLFPALAKANRLVGDEKTESP